MKSRIVAVSVSALLLAGCGQAAEMAVESATGTDVEISDDEITITGEDGSMTVDTGDGSTTFTDEESGVTIESGTDVELPAGVPEGFPLPSSGSLIAASEDSGSGTVILSWSWDNITRDDVDSYIQSLVAAGYVEQPDGLEQDYGDTGFIKGANLAGDSHDVSVTAQGMEGMGGITITISPSG